MQCINLNNHKIYNVTVGKTLPEWLSDRQKRKLQKQDLDIRRRIELIQDFEMPILSTAVRISRNQQYVMATGVYKPRVRCYDVNQKSMKFDRCMDAEVVSFQILSDDYTKLVFLQNDRFVEFHNQAGYLYRTRIPMYGRDFDYLKSKAELFFVGKSNEIVRMNLEKATFLNPIKTDASEILSCQLNDRHEFLLCGTSDGRLEAFDPRTRGRINAIDCKLFLENNPGTDTPAVTSIRYSGDLSVAAGTSTGHILLFDIRSNKPLNIKDHRFGLPIKNIEFSKTETNHDVVISSDSRIVKIWEKDSGRPYTSIEPGMKLNDVCLVPNTGMMFIANETQKIQIYFVPDLGPAPSWCSKLTGMTEELEEDPEPQIYDNYKFLTLAEVESLGLTGSIGQEWMRAEMHGYFIKMDLYLKFKELAQPFNYEVFRKKKLAKKNEPKSRIAVDPSHLPKVNTKLAERLFVDDKSKVKKDTRFTDLFEDEDFEIDETSEEFLLQKPRHMKLERKRKQQEETDELQSQAPSGVKAKTWYDQDDDDDDEDDEFKQELKKQYRLINEERKKERQKTNTSSTKSELHQVKSKDEKKPPNKQNRKTR